MRSKKLLLLAAVAAAAFAWGALAARRELFPYPQAQRAWAWVRGLFGAGGAGAGAGELDNWGALRVRDLPDDNQALRNLPYVGAHQPASEQSGVTSFDADAAWPGVNLVVSGHAPEARLVDMDGNEIHHWHKRFDEVWQEPLAFEEFEVHKTFWRRAHVFPNGDLLAIFEGIGMIKLDVDSNLIWAKQCRAHHDLFVDEQGAIHTLAREWREGHPTLEVEGRYLEDHVLVLSTGGEEVSRVSVLQSLVDSDFASLLLLAGRSRDILHTNTIEVLDGREAARYPMLQKGHVLLSLPSLNAVVVLDPGRRTVTWALAGLFGFQHQPTVLDGGRLLVFDNLGGKHDAAAGTNGISRVLEIDPLTQRIEWRYRGSELAPFESKVLGSCQRLPNGNTLITESTAGRAFEVRPDGKIAWEYFNPARGGDDGTLIAYLMEVVRLDPAPLAAAFPQLGGTPVQIDAEAVRRLREGRR